MPNKKVTFVLPGRNRSGGVRVTVAMANKLRELGYEVRIVYKTAPFLSYKWIRSIAKKNVRKVQHNLDRTDWLYQFNGPVQKFVNIKEVKFHPGEIVIAVGIYTVEDVRKLDDSIIKIRYNHGFSVGMDKLTRTAWGGKMPTIAVSSTLIPRLQELSQDRVLGVVPNGLNLNEYYADNITRRVGIGIMYSTHPNKCPQDIIRLMCRIRLNWPDIPQYYFGTEHCPDQLQIGKYVRYPTIDDARHIYNLCMIWLSTSQEEGFGIPILEAMACGCAVVSADNPGARELITDGENGFIVPVGGMEAFLDKIKILLSDEHLRQRVVLKGLETAQSFSWEKAAGAMDAILQKVDRL